MTPIGRSYQIVPWLDEQLGTVRIFGLLLGSLAEKDRGRQLPSASCFSSAGHFTCLNARHSSEQQCKLLLNHHLWTLHIPASASTISPWFFKPCRHVLRFNHALKSIAFQQSRSISTTSCLILAHPLKVVVPFPWAFCYLFIYLLTYLFCFLPLFS